MKIYQVGGAVRDRLLGLPVQDVDYVVVGSTPEAMLAAGYRPVGKDFPVFLHPRSHEEYALARTERKTAAGYKGFAFYTDASVTLEEDLIRRDLTINAMALGDDGQIIDPYGGQADLQARILRHVSPAFEEDPVRILRLARFAARFSAPGQEFSVAPETMQLMRNMVAAGEVDALVPERVWQEIARGLMEQRPSRMIEILKECGALARLLPELLRLWGVPQPLHYHPEGDTGVHCMLVVDQAAQRAYPLAVRFAALLHDLGKGVTDPAAWPAHHGHEAMGVPLTDAVCQRLRVPADCRDLAVMTTREHGVCGQAAILRPATIADLFQRCDAYRKPDRFRAMLLAIECDYCGRTGYETREFRQKALLEAALQAALSVDAGAVAKACTTPARIPEAVRSARIDAIRAWRKSTDLPTGEDDGAVCAAS